MNDIKTFVQKVYTGKRNLWLIKKSLLSITIFLGIYLFWILFNRIFVITPLEWRLMPLSFIPVSLPFLHNRPIIMGVVEHLENRIKELKGRLYLIMEPFPTPLDSEKYRKQAIKECSSILKTRNAKEFAESRIDVKFILPPPILLIILAVTGFHLNRVYPKPMISFVETPTKKGSPTLILAECPSLSRLYLLSDNRVRRMQPLQNGRFGIIIRPEHSLEISTGYRGWKSHREKITVVPPIDIKKLTLEYQFPSYLAIGSLYDTILSPDSKIPIRVLSGTIVNFWGEASVELGSISKNLSLAEVDGNHFRGSFIVGEETTLKVELMDTHSFLSHIVHFLILPIRDEPPMVKFISPEGDYKLDQSMEVFIVLEASDDYGLSKLQLLSGNLVNDIKITEGIRFVEDSFNLILSNLLPGDTLIIRAAAIDCAGNRTLSAPIKIFMPTLQEMFSDYSEFSDTLSKMTEELRDREKEIKEKIEKFLESSDLNPETRYSIKETLKEQRDLLEDIEKMAELAKKMQNPLILKELEKIKQLLDELGTQKLMEQLKRIEENQDYTGKELKDLKLSQEELLKALELGRKSLESLKSLMELNEFINRAEEIYERQEEIVSKIPDDSLASLEESLRDALNKMIDEMMESSTKELKEMAEEFEKTKTGEKMGKLAGEMREGKMTQATIEDIKEALKNLCQSLKNAREERTGERIREVIKAKAWELGFILRHHDALIDDRVGLEKGLIEQGLAEGIDRINRELESIFIMSFAFSPKVLQNLSEVSSMMKDLGQELIKDKPLRSSMERVNNLLIEAIIHLFESPPSSGQAMMSAMNQILSRQKGISDQLSQLFPLPAKGRSQTLQKLARKQKGLAKELRDLGEALNPLAREMEAIAERMERGELDKKLIERQKKVLDRLLEANKSIRRKDISKKRRSNPGIFVSPPRVTLPEDLGEKRKELRELLEKRMKEPYPAAYKKEIEMYIRKLLE